MNDQLMGQESQPQHNQLITLANDFGYTGELTPGALEDGIRSAMRRTIEDVIDLGARLLLLKEVTGHGEFSKRIELLGLSPRMCQKFMLATQKFSKANSKAVLNIVGTQTKLLELLVLDDEEIELLANGETIGELNLGALECMSVSELKQAVRDRDKKLEDMENSKSKQVKHFEAEIEHRDALIEKLKSRDNRDYVFQPKTHIVREECLVYQAECEVALNSLEALFEECLNDLVETEKTLRIEQVYITANVVAARAATLVSKLKDIAAHAHTAELPITFSSIHTLTDDEAERWLLDYKGIERKSYAAKALREQKREDAMPKRPGRPSTKGK